MNKKYFYRDNIALHMLELSSFCLHRHDELQPFVINQYIKYAFIDKFTQ